MSKKNIDELFKEQFEEFDEIPDPKVWKNIENSLDKKKSRKAIPIWWKLGGAAAVLAVLFYAVNPIDKISKDTIEVTNKSEEQTRGHKEKDVKENNASEEVQYSNTDEKIKNDIENSKSQEEADIIKNSPAYVKDEGSNNSSQKNNSNNQKANQNKLKQSLINTTNNVVVTNEQENTNSNNEYSNATKNEVPIQGNSNLTIQEKQNTIVANELEKENFANRSISEKSSLLIQNEKLSKEAADNALVEVSEEEKKATDKMEAQKKSIFDEIADIDEEDVAKNKDNKWSVGPSVAPVYFNGMGQGSPISASFTPNSKSGDVNLSYGVAVAYGISKKLKIRSGVYKVDYGYNTNDIEFTSSFGPNATAQIANINYKNTSSSILVESIVSGESKSNSPSFANDISAKSAVLEGSLSQQFGYIEVPFELNYALLDKRFGINVIGGVSSLFLINNDILLNSGDQTTEMGEANNINDVNFSTNFGFGINYKITPKLQFNVEPLFKYQLNTFSNSAGNFQPFSVGVYSGVNFKF